MNALSVSLGYAPVSDEVAQDRLQELLSSSSDRVWVIEDDAQICAWMHAFIAYRVASPSFVEIGGIVVSPERRRQGLGRSLVDRARQWGRERKLKLRVRCNHSRDETHRFYESIGFTKSKSQYVFEVGKQQDGGKSRGQIF